jgi:hypothetical protein
MKFDIIAEPIEIPTWEYTQARSLKEANKLGAEGWEAVAIGHNYYEDILMKRPTGTMLLPESSA